MLDVFMFFFKILYTERATRQRQQEVTAPSREIVLHINLDFVNIARLNVFPCFLSLCKANHLLVVAYLFLTMLTLQWDGLLI